MLSNKKSLNNEMIKLGNGGESQQSTDLDNITYIECEVNEDHHDHDATTSEIVDGNTKTKTSGN